MTKQKRGDNAKGRNVDPNQDVQPWLGWIAAMLVVVIVVVAVAMGMERTSNQRSGNAEVRMTPLVGGIEVPVATEASTVAAVAVEVTPVPEAVTAAITESGTVSMVTVITATDGVTETDTFTATGEMTPTLTVTVTDEATGTDTVTETLDITDTAEITDETGITSTVEVTGTDDMTGTDEMTATVESAETVAVTVEATGTQTTTPAPTDTQETDAVATITATVEATATPRSTSTPRSTNTPRPTATSATLNQVFDVGATVAASSGRVALHADAMQDAFVLDSVGPGVELEVLPPSGDYEEYPVVVDDVSWVRVRAADGLVGWVHASLVEEQ